ncbi:hypothetical protein [Spirosoma harenae]
MNWDYMICRAMWLNVNPPYPSLKTFNGRRVDSISLKKRLVPATRRIVLDGLQVEQSVAEICRREGFSTNIYYRWIGRRSGKEFLEAGKKPLAGDTTQEATPPKYTPSNPKMKPSNNQWLK